MKKMMLLLPVLALGCVRPAHHDLPTPTARHTFDREEDLRFSIDHAIHQQEMEDRRLVKRQLEEKYPWRMYVYDRDGNLSWIYK